MQSTLLETRGRPARGRRYVLLHECIKLYLHYFIRLYDILLQCREARKGSPKIIYPALPAYAAINAFIKPVAPAILLLLRFSVVFLLAVLSLPPFFGQSFSTSIRQRSSTTSKDKMRLRNGSSLPNTRFFYCPFQARTGRNGAEVSLKK